MANRTALIAGATGLVGRELLQALLQKNQYDKIILLQRREAEVDDPRVQSVVVEDFANMQTVKEQLFVQDYYCTLGTTIKQAGSKDAFKKVDLEYPLLLAQVAQQSPDFRQFLVVTSAGANANSPLFYNNVKGQVEQQLRAMELPSLQIFRPSLLLGERKEFRLGEEVAKFGSRVLSFFMVGMRRNLWSIDAKDVAKAMAVVASQERSGTHIFGSSEMYKIVNKQGL
ncbi:NAD-dependent epimerase/dehydratase family protein [Marinoscillum furvescens]|uniref:Putative NAD(P)-binding protein n=1 Tax=Marinoscillum furvescens DSM 4134 TaxID=1122208 RepID=A0A3D9KWW3_MARFU|nr:NAD-dependent epimerase/dehydratase family protein [Marinoscillum furvescens]RED92637.1 putative NAD(P)-binding protein [Marinoscillum furvescens DSM 4134]